MGNRVDHLTVGELYATASNAGVAPSVMLHSLVAASSSTLDTSSSRTAAMRLSA
jgi:hypothetical protein